MQIRASSSHLLVLGLGVSLIWGCGTSAVLTLAPAAMHVPAGPVVTGPASLAYITLNGRATFQGSPLAGYSLEVYDAKSGKPLEKKADLTGVTTLALLDKNLTVGPDGKFSLRVAGLGAGQALRVVCRSASGVAKLEMLVFGDRQALKYKLQQANDIDELTTALSHGASGVLTSSMTITPEAASAVLSRLADELEALSPRLRAALTSSPTFAGELVRASTPGEQANAMRSLVENAGVLRQLTQLVADRVSEISQQAHEAGNQNPEATSPEIQALLRRVDFLGTRIAGQLDNKAVELIFGDTRQPVNGGSLDSFIALATTSSSGGSGGGGAPTTPYAELVKNLNNQDADTGNDTDRQALDSAAVVDALDQLKANKEAFGADWAAFEALTPEDLAAPPGPPPSYRVLDAAPAYTLRQQAVGQLILERVFRNKTGTVPSGYRVLASSPNPVPYADIQKVRDAFHEAVELETRLKALLAAIKPATVSPIVVAYHVLVGASTPTQQQVIDAFDLALADKLDADFAQLETWRIRQISDFTDPPVSDVDGCQFAMFQYGDSLKDTVQAWKDATAPETDLQMQRVIDFFQDELNDHPEYTPQSDAHLFYAILAPTPM